MMKSLQGSAFRIFLILPRMAKIWLNFINDLKEQRKKINALKSNGDRQVKLKRQLAETEKICGDTKEQNAFIRQIQKAKLCRQSLDRYMKNHGDCPKVSK